MRSDSSKRFWAHNLVSSDRLRWNRPRSRLGSVTKPSIPLRSAKDETASAWRSGARKNTGKALGPLLEGLSASRTGAASGSPTNLLHFQSPLGCVGQSEVMKDYGRGTLDCSVVDVRQPREH